MQYKAAKIIQTSYKRFIIRKYQLATTIVTSFLRYVCRSSVFAVNLLNGPFNGLFFRTMLRKQALITAVWAAKVIRRFSANVCAAILSILEISTDRTSHIFTHVDCIPAGDTTLEGTI